MSTSLVQTAGDIIRQNDFLDGDSVFVDIYSGCGGASMGFILAGMKPVVVVDGSKKKRAMYKENFNFDNFFQYKGSYLTSREYREKETDALVKMVQQKLGNIKVKLHVHGSPSCVEASKARGAATSRKKLGDSAGTIMWFLTAVEKLKEKFTEFSWSMEEAAELDNPERWKKIKGNTDYDMYAKIEELEGIKKVVNFKDWGVPQDRKRLIVCSKNLVKGDLTLGFIGALNQSSENMTVRKAFKIANAFDDDIFIPEDANGLKGNTFNTNIGYSHLRLQKKLKEKKKKLKPIEENKVDYLMSRIKRTLRVIGNPPKEVEEVLNKRFNLTVKPMEKDWEQQMFEPGTKVVVEYPNGKKEQKFIVSSMYYDNTQTRVFYTSKTNVVHWDGSNNIIKKDDAIPKEVNTYKDFEKFYNDKIEEYQKKIDELEKYKNETKIKELEKELDKFVKKFIKVTDFLSAEPHEVRLVDGFVIYGDKDLDVGDYEKHHIYEGDYEDYKDYNEYERYGLIGKVQYDFNKCHWIDFKNGEWLYYLPWVEYTDEKLNPYYKKKTSEYNLEWALNPLKVEDEMYNTRSLIWGSDDVFPERFFSYMHTKNGKDIFKTAAVLFAWENFYAIADFSDKLFYREIEEKASAVLLAWERFYDIASVGNIDERKSTLKEKYFIASAKFLWLEFLTDAQHKTYIRNWKKYLNSLTKKQLNNEENVSLPKRYKGSFEETFTEKGWKRLNKKDSEEAIVNGFNERRLRIATKLNMEEIKHLFPWQWKEAEEDALWEAAQKANALSGEWKTDVPSKEYTDAVHALTGKGRDDILEELKTKDKTMYKWFEEKDWENRKELGKHTGEFLLHQFGPNRIRSFDEPSPTVTTIPLEWVRFVDKSWEPWKNADGWFFSLQKLSHLHLRVLGTFPLKFKFENEKYEY